MSKQLKKIWITKLGLSPKAIKSQKVLRVTSKYIELLNVKHGVITYISREGL